VRVHTLKSNIVSKIMIEMLD